jgi:hypothetical protein
VNVSAAEVRCRDQPISWLELERFALDELEPARAASVQQHLQGCPACAICLGRIREPAATLVLPPLTVRPPPPRGEPLAVRARRRWPWLAGVGLAGATAAALVLAVPALRPPGGTASKGVEVALTLVRERQGAVTEDPAGYRPDDRWKALVTCPEGRELAWALVMLQDPAGGGSAPVVAPVASGSRLGCGNRVALPGAFRLTGQGPAAVCFVGLLGGMPGSPPTARDLQAIEQGAADQDSGVACVRLTRDPG